MEPQLNTGVIYSVTCIPTGKSYIGQAKDYKYKNNIPYRYGVDGRWSDHMSNDSTTPLRIAIKEYGADNFLINVLHRCDIGKLDAWEAATIKHNNTHVPNGYNVMKHSRVKNREDSNIHEFFINRTKGIKVKPIKNSGVNKLVYVYLTLKDEPDKVRLTFGQSNGSTFEMARSEALSFIKLFQERNIPIEINPGIHNDDDLLAKYHEKINSIMTKPIRKIRITTMGGLIAVYVSHEGIKSYKEQIRTTFGGKHIRMDDSYKLAKLFVEKIKGSVTQIVDSYKAKS